MDGVADLVAGKAARLAIAVTVSVPYRRDRPQPEHSLREVPVRAALEQGERAVREPADVVERRRGERLERRELETRRRQGRRHVAEERELGRGVGLRLDRHRDRLRGLGEAIDAEEEAGLAALDLARLVLRVGHLATRLQTVEHPADRRLAIAGSLDVDRAGDDEPVDRTRHRDVVEAEPLRALLLALGLAHLLEAEHRPPVTARRVHHPEPEPPVGERNDLVAAARSADVAPGVRDDHDLELEALRRVDREQAHRVGALFLGDGLELLRAERILLADEADEAREVAPADRLVLPREAAELAEIREAPCAVPAREHGEVVVVLGEDLLAEALEPDSRRSLDEPLVALAEGAEQAIVLGRETLLDALLERGEERPPGRVSPDEDERVVRDPDERRREDGRERDVVVAVVQEPEIREQVDDLLLTEVAASGRAEGRQALDAQRLLVALGVGPGGEEDDDLARHRLAGVDELAHAPSRSRGPRPPPVRSRPFEARLVGDEELDRMPEHGVGELGRGRERLVLVSERALEQVVDGREHLRTRAVVAPERQQLTGLRTALAEDPDVGVPEPVDRLELVADREHLRLVRVRDEVDELALEPVRVLELVDHDHAEAEANRVAHRLVVAEEVARRELEVLEVDDRLAPLRVRVLRREALEQLLEQIPVGRGELLERRPLDRLPRVLVRRRAAIPGTTARTGPRPAPAGSPRRRPAAPRRPRAAGSRLPSRLRPAPSPPPGATTIAPASAGRSPSSSRSSRPAERSVS